MMVSSIKKNNAVLVLSLIAVLGIAIRVIFTPWEYASSAPDSVTYLARALNFAGGDFGALGTDFVFMWPLVLSVFLAPFGFESQLDYLNVMRVVALSVSVGTMPVVYLVAKHFVKKRYAYMAALLYVLGPNLIENSGFAITEPLFLFLSVISLYFVLQKDDRLFLLAFVFAALSFDTRQNGIVMLIVVLIGAGLRFQSKRQLARICMIGVAIFVLCSVQYVMIPLENDEIPFLWRITSVIEAADGQRINPHLINPILPDLTDSENAIYQNMLLKEMYHIFRVSIPYLVIFTPIGLLIAFRRMDYQTKVLLSVVITSLLVAFPQYAVSGVYRNLFLLIPVFCVFSAMAIQRIFAKYSLRDIFMLCLCAGLVVTSAGFLNEQLRFDKELFSEKELFGMYVADNFQGTIMGDNYNFIRQNILDLTGAIPLKVDANESITLIVPGYAILDYDSLGMFIDEHDISYVIIDDKLDNRYFVFQDILADEAKYPELRKVYDSEMHDYKKYKVKVFEVLR